MRKIVFLLIMVLAIVGCYIVSVEGVQSNLIQIASYDEVKAANKQLDTQISELNRKNTTEYESKRTALTTAVKNYKDKKEKYEALAPTVQETDEQEPEETTTSNTKPYDVDFLWTIVGNYATETGISIDVTFTFCGIFVIIFVNKFGIASLPIIVSFKFAPISLVESVVSLDVGLFNLLIASIIEL